MREINEKKIQQYIDQICSHIKWKEVHKQITLEIEDHLYEIIERHKRNGMQEDQAVEDALMHMGDADLIGKQLHNSHR